MKDQVALYFGVGVEAVLGCRVIGEGDEAHVRALVDYGIGGVKVYKVPVIELDTLVVVEDKPEPLPVPVAVNLNDDDGDLSYRDLQALAKEAGIPANQSADELREALEDLTGEDDE